MKRSYDLTQLEKLADGDNDFVKEMVDLFIENESINIAEMKAALNNEDYDSVGFLAHKIKPSLDLMGLAKLVRDIRRIEEYSKERINLEKVADLVNNLDKFCSKVIKELKEDYPDQT